MLQKWVSPVCSALSVSLETFTQYPTIASLSIFQRYSLKPRNCLWNKFSQFLQIFTKFAKLNPHEKSTGSQFVKLNPRWKKNYFFFSELARIYIFTLDSLSINDDHVKILFYRVSNNWELNLLYPNNAIWNIEKFRQEFRDSHTAS